VAGGRVDKFGATPDGFRMVNASLYRLIMTVYVPQSGSALFLEPKGFPAWVGRERYDIEAKVSEADIPRWQNPALQPVMLRAMLQQLLADRCHLVVHRVFEDAVVYNLVIGKSGPKFNESKAGEPYPNGQEARYPGGGLFVSEGETMHFYQAPMTLLASMLTNRNLGGRPVLDRTGLTGRYDFVVPWGAWTAGIGAAEGDASDPGPTLKSAVEAIGLKLVPANGQVENLVLDQIERPSGN
jgi:uncharacterized protein (TIGR03435 family)